MLPNHQSFLSVPVCEDIFVNSLWTESCLGSVCERAFGGSGHACVLGLVCTFGGTDALFTVNFTKMYSRLWLIGKDVNSL